MARQSLTPWGGGRGPFDWMRQEMENMMGELGRRFGSDRLPLRGGAWLEIEMDLSETDREVRFQFDIPGIDPKDVEVSVMNGDLVVRGEKRAAIEEKERHYRMVERSYGLFERRIALPPEADAEFAQAHFRNGVLTVTMAKRPEAQAQARRIPIEEANSEEEQRGLKP